MLLFRRLWRLLTIYRVVIRYGLDELLLSSERLRAVKLLLYLTPGYWLRDPHLSRGARLRLSLEDLGPIFIKFGQILSTRRDLLPDDIALELAKLQDHVKPFCGQEARQIVEQAYGKDLNELFAEFDTNPIASASIAQVHAARLHDGRAVVIKVLRPNIARQIKRDIELLYLIAELINRYWSDGKRLRTLEVVREFEKNLMDELDLLREASNCTLLRRNFQHSKQLYIPEIEWHYTQAHVLMMERIYGIPISDFKTMREAGVNFKYLAEIGVEIFFTQVFRDNFFHADMHPGNIFVDIRDPNYPSYIAVDFGIMGTLSDEDQHYLAANFLAFFQRDYRRVAELHLRSEWVPAGTRVEEFEAAIRSVCEPMFDRPLKEISFGLVLLRLFQTARRFNMEIQPQLVLLQKTLLNIEGLGRQLYPDLDLWQTAKPYLERWMDERIGLRAFMRNIEQQLPIWAEKLPELPMLVHEALSERQQQQHQLKQLRQEMQHLRRDLKQQHERATLATIGSALLICASIILALETRLVWNLPALGTLLGLIGAILLVIAWLS
ncbi:ubiquinone biosynthesis regulatory protein kinase UbiB [Thioflexithrix psekupsensis]|uniref:Probable protein kinase UbiB n=1 Tax=Thioflexithrix psekupsensis TaxID=1570016 RepID=A0A251X494_9GAMM|nr:ubiquinone biosynthesis regulatory protein kinase UbiB [Thioflexithrix psekupsensis]OUD12271.1 ubiquinone biosynthesis regulatory protein kinase UbiB [Thioflexithrix psekupsensis]